MLIDTHAHLNFQAFQDDLEQVLKHAQSEGVEKIINVGTDLDSSQKALEIAQKYDCCYASVGIHPHHACNTESTPACWQGRENSLETLKELAQHPKVVAIGEIGLDYHPYENGGIANPQKQKELFLAQLEIARKLNLPVIFHCREAHQEMVQLIKPPARGVFHCFSGDEEFLRRILKLGFYIGFDGNLTFKNAQELQKLAQITPLEKILLETDSPYLSPEPLRGLRNEPKNVRVTAEFLSRLKGLSFTQVCQITTENAEEFFTQIR